MRKLVLIAITLIACGREPSTWSGIPDGPRTCAWNDRSDVGQCISSGAAYACVHDQRQHHVECARVSPSLTPELGAPQ